MGGKPVSFCLGGPWYGSRVDANLALSLARIAALSPVYNLACGSLVYEDTLLDLARNRLLSKAIAEGADWLVSIDADCSLERGDVVPLFTALREQLRGDVALVAACVRQGNGWWNVKTAAGEQLDKPPDGPLAVSRVGFGLVAFRLGWYVSHWPHDREPYFRTRVLPNPNVPYGWEAVGEDFDHCAQVIQRGGKVLVDGRIRVKHHVARAGSWADRAIAERLP